jgi:glycine/D-amino acid oxidase-like deaminating enzyme
MGHDTVDVVVIGAGIHGASTAFHLTKAGLTVLVLERRAIASGATGRSSGIVRLHYDRDAETQLAWASFAYFRDWADTVGGDCGFVRTGFVRIVAPSSEAALVANVERGRRLGIPSLVITADDVARLAPAFDVSDFAKAAYEPESGYADPTLACTSMLAAARHRGAEVRHDTEVVDIVSPGSTVTGVRTATGLIATKRVVIAAGAWSAGIGRMVGLELPITVWHHDTAFIERPPSVRYHPALIDDIHSLYLRPEGRHLTLVGLKDGNRTDGILVDDPATDPSFAELAAERACRRVPALADGGLQSVHSGIDGITPDQRPIIGAAGPEGCYLQTGFSGTGFKLAPAVGACVAELITTGRAPTADISPFGLDRFAVGATLQPDEPYAYAPAWL